MLKMETNVEAILKKIERALADITDNQTPSFQVQTKTSVCKIKATFYNSKNKDFLGYYVKPRLLITQSFFLHFVNKISQFSNLIRDSSLVCAEFQVGFQYIL